MSRISIEKSEPFLFFDTVLKNSTKTLTELIELNCRAKNIVVAIPPGPEGDLQIRAYFLTPKDTPRELFNFIGDRNYFDGDDIKYDIPLDVPILAQSTLIVEAKNLDLNYDYSLNVVINVAYDIEV